MWQVLLVHAAGHWPLWEAETLNQLQQQVSSQGSSSSKRLFFSWLKMLERWMETNHFFFAALAWALCEIDCIMEAVCPWNDHPKWFESNVFVGRQPNWHVCQMWRVFNKMPLHNAVAWMAMLQALAMHGHGKEACMQYGKMCQEGEEDTAAIDTVIFIALLWTCYPAGLVYKGLHYFDSMGSACSIAPTSKHYVYVWSWLVPAI